MVVLVIVYANGVVRLRFWHALTASLSILFVYLAAIPLNSVPPPFGVQFNYIAVIGSAILFTLFANYSLERSERLNYLHDLRDRIHRAELAASNARLKELSHLDPLTGIPNRRDMDVHLEQLCRSPEALPLSVVMIDVDRFKLYNDRYGHQAGDECLRRIASILQASLRYTYDRVARYGGEEFAVVLPKTNPSQAVEVAERMRKAVLGLMIPHQDSTYGAVVTISAGVAAFTAPGDPASILAMADQALYAAKDSGGNRVVSLTAGNGNPADPYESAA
jgi:diguanylate cyclase (GGDEF)-like protein